MIDESAAPVPRPQLEYHELDDGGVIYDASRDKVHTLNGTAAYVWNCLDGSHSLAQIALNLHEHVHRPVKALIEDVRTVVSHFQHEGLLRS
jgi:hypothetical protein